ncbi:glycosyl hydrolase 115 family protein [Marinilabilia salmonicolor]|uniref:Glycosyl hydrolase family 115 (Putative glucuronidase) n=1 Tax=Marinilabilia salmonicolor TaxID=989 RepID=A0A368V4R9_9BACT|nr:glycosyl hydrolase 115 family protein [Marinilabilia salmonicolor]RCW36082.1 glycosyl hydrolase family 115 (putative glucuronidase) [Marinilabilia salmonicolor]
MKITSLLFSFLLFFLLHSGSNAQQPANRVLNYLDYTTQSKPERGFPLFENGDAAVLYVANSDEAGVKRVAKLLQKDILKVSGVEPRLVISDTIPGAEHLIIIGTIDKSPVLQQLAEKGVVSVDDVKGMWEATVVTTVKTPVEGVQSALVIAGSDKRGTIYGMFDLSQQMGVSPWYWWADVPVKKKNQLFVKGGRYVSESPKVKYRGIFLNDEEPALGNWVRENFGDFNAQFYDKVFELILRMKGNFLWPAMWGKAFYDDDPQNAELADEYGVVISTSHHEPMMRAHVEWDRYGEGSWDYNRNADKLKEFWRVGIDRMGDNESLVTVGMRGDGDEPMSTNRNIELLSDIIDNQRRIIAEETEKPASQTPQVWALYKEVQDYYDMGMRVDEDITLLYCDDNWGNVRRMPGEEERQRIGGSGMYYHFDYVGGPRNYKWLNTSPLPRVWEQMKLSYAHGIDQLWVVNVGDLKPMELPIQFFLNLAWNPDAMGTEELDAYPGYWAAQQFGAEHAEEIAHYLRQYTKFNGRRKPELISPDTYSLTYYNEFERVVTEYDDLARNARVLYNDLAEEQKDAFYQLVLFPVEACANLNRLYYVTAKNRLYAGQNRVLTNVMADSVEYLFQKDQEMADYYHTEMADGKWNHMMSQTHIGYTYWQQPEQNNIPETQRIENKSSGELGVAVEGSEEWGPDVSQTLEMPVFYEIGKQSGYVEVFNRGTIPVAYELEVSDSWIVPESLEGQIDTQKRIRISVDWKKMVPGVNQGILTIQGRDDSVDVLVKARKFAPDELQMIQGFVETNGFISIEAEHFSDKNQVDGLEWRVIPDLGRTGSSVTVSPVTAESRAPGDEMSIDYPVHFTDTGEVTVYAHFAPTLNYTGGEGFRYAVGFEGEEPVMVNIHEDETHADWQSWVANNVNICSSKHKINQSGNHILKFYMVDPGLVLQKIVIDSGGLKPSYLGPEESPFVYH